MKRTVKAILVRLAKRLLGVLNEAESEETRRRLKSCGRNVQLHPPLCIVNAEHVTLGDNVSIAPFVHLWGLGGIRIGDRVMIGSHTAITTLTHDYHQERMQGTLVEKEVLIQEDAWIGAHSVIMPGITIGRGAVVGAGAVVTKDVEPYSVVVGVPATRLKYRDIRDLEALPSFE